MPIVVSLLIAVMASQSADQPMGRVTGRVFADGTNIPLVGARVVLVPVQPRSETRRPNLTAITQDDGAFLFDRIAAGRYGVNVEKAGYTSLAAYWPDETLFVDVAAGETVSKDLHLKRAAIITGRVVDAAGEPMPDLPVVLLRRRPDVGLSVASAEPQAGAGITGQRTNDLGEYRVAGLPAGDYFVAASSKPMVLLNIVGDGATTAPATTYYPGTTRQDDALAVSVKAGETVAGINFAMQWARAYRVRGVVIDQNGSPAAGVMVTMIGKSKTSGWMGRPGSATSRADGAFEIGGVPPDEYRLVGTFPMEYGGPDSIQMMRNGDFSINGTVAGGSDQPTTILVADADVSGVRVVVRRPR